MLGHRVGVQRAVGLVPAGDPAQGAGQGEGGDFGIAGGDRPFGDAAFDQVAEFQVDAAFERAQGAAAFFGQRLFADADHAHAEIHGDDADIGGHHRHQLLISAAAMADHVVRGGIEPFQPDAHALEQDLFLVLDVIVNRRFGDVQPPGDIVQRGVVIADLVERLRRRPQDGDSLLFPFVPSIGG